MQRVLAERIISASEFARNISATMREAQTGPIAVLKDNQIKAYLVSADSYETMLARLDDSELAALIHARKQETAEATSLDDL